MFFKASKELKREAEILQSACTAKEAVIAQLNVSIESLNKQHLALKERYDELSKRKENLVELLFAFRDMEVGDGLIKITRINPDDVWLRGRR